MLRRDVRHSLRRLSMTLSGLRRRSSCWCCSTTFSAARWAPDLGGAAPGGAYINYLVPGIFIMTWAAGARRPRSISVMDMSEGIIARFRTMAIARASVLNGQVLGSVIRTLISVGLVLGVALLMGFRPTAGLVAWIAALGLIALFTLALTWMGVVFGLVGKTPAGANSLALIFHPAAVHQQRVRPHDSMPGVVRWFAEYQPFTPVIDTLRGLLLGTPIGTERVAGDRLERRPRPGRLPVGASGLHARRVRAGCQRSLIAPGPHALLLNYDRSTGIPVGARPVSPARAASTRSFQQTA